MEEDKNNDGQIKFRYEVDLKTLTGLGEIQEGQPATDISVKIVNVLRNTLANMGSWVDEVALLIKSNDHRAAYQVFINNKNTLRLVKKNIFETLKLLDTSVLSTEERKDFILFLMLFASTEGKGGSSESIIDEYLKEFGDELQPSVKQTIILLKANAAAQNKKLNVANSYYQKAIESTETSIIDKAFAYRGLAMISGSQTDSNNYRYAAIDRFLEGGEKSEAVKDLAYLSEILATDSPKKSLELIDQAIELHNGGSILDKEFSAALYHKKAQYLYILNKNIAALECAEIACSLRENLVGNEHEKHASNTLAQSLCRIIKNPEKEKYYEDKVNAISPLIQTQEFTFQTKISESINKNEKLEDEFLQDVERSPFSRLKFSIYLYYATLNVYTFDEKIEWIDKAKLILNEKEFKNYEYSLLHFKLAELYIKNNLIDDAVKNYELCLNFNPFYSPATQNCGAILWKEKRWEKSLDFFKHQIEKLGDSPTLLYAIGRSHFELGDYQEAFSYLIRAKGKVDGPDIPMYIDLCIEKAENLKLTHLKEDINSQDVPISLDSLRQALKDFADTISTNSRMHFWEKNAGKHEWVSRPEEKCKQHLITALKMKYGKNAIDIIQERIAGAGIIDLYVALRGGLKLVIELKICGGSGYSSTYALSGEDQLIHYLKNSETHVGFLLVFDGRINDFGLGFKEVQSIDSFTIYTVAVEMSPKISKKGNS